MEFTVLKVTKDADLDRVTFDVRADTGYEFRCSVIHPGDESVEVMQSWIEEGGHRYNYLPDKPSDLFNGKGPQDAHSWRDGQREISVLATRLSLDVSVNVYIDAPTGAGKSVIAMGAAHAFGNWCNWKSKTVVLTLDHQLQQQYSSIPAVGSVTGRQNWICTLDTTKTAHNAPCASWMQHSECPKFKENLCPYYLQQRQAFAEPVIVTNYSYYLAASGNSVFPRPGLLICDEGHMAEQQVRSYCAATPSLEGMTRKERIVNLSKYSSPLPPLTDYQVWGEWLKKEMGRVADLRSRALEELSGTSGKEDLGGPQLAMLTANYTHLNRQFQELQSAWSLVDSYEKDPVLLFEDGKRLTVTPVIGNLDMLSYCNTIFLSATMVDPGVTDPRMSFFIEMPSTFPVESRPVKALPGPRLSIKSSEQDYRQVSYAIDQILQRHSNEKGLIHCVSYDLGQKIIDNSSFPSLLIGHGSGGRDSAVAAFRAAPPGRALVSPSVSAGLDLPYDACRWQVIAKLPFPNLGDPLAKARQEFRPKISILDTARAIVQMAGRGMRAEDDHCVVYITDGNFKWFYRQNFKYFPDWFRQAVEFVS